MPGFRRQTRCFSRAVDRVHGQESSTGYKVQSEAAKGVAINRTEDVSDVDGSPEVYADHLVPRFVRDIERVVTKVLLANGRRNQRFRLIEHEVMPVIRCDDQQ